jgi:hypothetical protein
MISGRPAPAVIIPQPSDIFVPEGTGAQIFVLGNQGKLETMSQGAKGPLSFKLGSTSEEPRGFWHQVPSRAVTELRNPNMVRAEGHASCSLANAQAARENKERRGACRRIGIKVQNRHLLPSGPGRHSFEFCVEIMAAGAVQRCGGQVKLWETWNGTSRPDTGTAQESWFKNPVTASFQRARRGSYPKIAGNVLSCGSKIIPDSRTTNPFAIHAKMQNEARSSVAEMVVTNQRRL